MLRIATVDDEADITAMLKEYIQRFAEETGREIIVESYKSGFELLGISKFPDIVFLDVEMPNFNGMETARAIREKDDGCIIIFITNMARYAIEGYSVNALDYILKPVNYSSFYFKLQRAVEVAEKMQKATITVTVKYGKIRVAVSDIYYVEVIKHKLIYHTSDGDIEVWDSMKNVQSVLERFFGLKLAIRYNAERYDEMLKVIIRRNVGLLRNTASQVVDNVQSIVTDAMTTGRGWADIEHALNNQHEIAQNRVKRIARDQTAKATEAINIMMQRAAGAEYFEWSTSKDERVSTGFGGHKQLDGKIYRYDEPERYPIIDSYGNRGLPAQRVNCRCTSLSVFIMDGYRAKWSPSDECYKIVKE